MPNPWIFLVLLLGTPTGEAAQLSYNVLARIVSAFQRTAGRPPSDDGGGQFSFLMALTPNQCTNNNLDLQFLPNRSGAPRIEPSPQNFLNTEGANYIAVYPNRGRQCSEKKILHRWQDPNVRSAAETFVSNIEDRQMRVGCVIFYTTYTPCTNRCFSDNQNWCIVEPIAGLASQLSNIGTTSQSSNRDIGKYLVFSKVYRYDTGKAERNITMEKMGKVANSGFSIRRCDRDSRGLFCELCRPPSFCVDWVASGWPNSRNINQGQPGRVLFSP